MYIGHWDVAFVCKTTKATIQKLEIKLTTPRPQTDVGYLGVAAQAAMSSDSVCKTIRGDNLPGSVRAGIFISPTLKSCSHVK